MPLSDGTVVIADDRYIHDSIVRPESQIVAGYAPIMPSFAGQISEEDLLKLVAYIKSLRTGAIPMSAHAIDKRSFPQVISRAPISRMVSRFAVGY